MKKLTAIALVGMICLTACAQEKKAVPAMKIIPQKTQPAAPAGEEISYTVSGTCAADVKMVYVVDPSNPRNVLDSIAVTNGKFSYTGKAAKNDMRNIHDGNKNMSFIIDGTPVALDLVAEKISGSALTFALQFSKTQSVNSRTGPPSGLRVIFTAERSTSVKVQPAKAIFPRA